jgi:hypothetical protein
VNLVQSDSECSEEEAGSEPDNDEELVEAAEVLAENSDPEEPEPEPEPDQPNTRINQPRVHELRPCGQCKNDVQKGNFCDICDSWMHVFCGIHIGAGDSDIRRCSHHDANARPMVGMTQRILHLPPPKILHHNPKTAKQ